MIHHPSPNFGPRRNGESPSLVVLHFTEMATAEAALERLCSPQAEVSAHYMIGRDGTVWHLVDEKLRAWHAGAGAWQGHDDVNSRSIGIELDNDGTSPFSAPLMRTLETLLTDICTRWQISSSGVIAHSDMAPGRKVDPGPRFDWQRLARLDLAHWPKTIGDPKRPLSASLDEIGYPAAPADTRLQAFRLRFGLGAKGQETDRDRAMADALAQSQRS
mgnify:CR=1 FL=1